MGLDAPALCVIEQRAQVARSAEVAESLGQGRRGDPGRRQVHDQADGAVAVAGRAPQGGKAFGHPPGAVGTHVGSAADLGAYHFLALGVLVGPAHGAQGKPERVGQLSLRRQLGAGGQRTVGNGLADGLGQGAMLRPAVAGEVWQPYCHCDN